MEDGTLKKIQKTKKVLIMAASVLAFCMSLYYAFFIYRSGDENAVSGEAPVVQDNYQEYSDYVSNTNKGIKSLLEGEQLKQIKLYDSPPADIQEGGRDNPFAKPF